MTGTLLFCVTVMAGERRLSGPSWKEVERNKTLIDLFLQTCGTRILGQEVQVLVSKEQSFMEAAVVQICSPLVTLQHLGQNHIQFVLKSSAWSPSLIATLKEAMLRYPAEKEAMLRYPAERECSKEDCLKLEGNVKDLSLPCHLHGHANMVDSSGLLGHAVESPSAESSVYHYKQFMSEFKRPQATAHTRFSFEDMTVDQICAEIKRIKASHSEHIAPSWREQATRRTSLDDQKDKLSEPGIVHSEQRNASPCCKVGEAPCKATTPQTKEATALDGQSDGGIRKSNSVSSASQIPSVSRLTESARNKMRNLPVKPSLRSKRLIAKRPSPKPISIVPSMERNRTTVITRSRGCSALARATPCYEGGARSEAITNKGRLESKVASRNLKAPKEQAIRQLRPEAKVNKERSDRTTRLASMHRKNLGATRKSLSPGKSSDLFVEIYVPDKKPMHENPLQLMANIGKDGRDTVSSATHQCNDASTGDLSKIKSQDDPNCRSSPAFYVQASDESQHSTKEFSSDSLLNQSDPSACTITSAATASVEGPCRIKTVSRSMPNGTLSEDMRGMRIYKGDVDPDLKMGCSAWASENKKENSESVLSAAKHILEVSGMASVDNVLSNLSQSDGLQTKHATRRKSASFFAPLLELNNSQLSSCASNGKLTCESNLSPKHAASVPRWGASNRSSDKATLLLSDSAIDENSRNQTVSLQALISCGKVSSTVCNRSLVVGSEDGFLLRSQPQATLFSTGKDSCHESLNQTFTLEEELHSLVGTNYKSGGEDYDKQEALGSSITESGQLTRRQWASDFGGMDDLVVDSLLLFSRDLRLTADIVAGNIRKLYEKWLTNTDCEIASAHLAAASKSSDSPDERMKHTKQENVAEIFRNMRKTEVRLKTLAQEATLYLLSFHSTGAEDSKRSTIVIEQASLAMICDVHRGDATKSTSESGSEETGSPKPLQTNTSFKWDELKNLVRLQSLSKTWLPSTTAKEFLSSDSDD